MKRAMAFRILDIRMGDLGFYELGRKDGYFNCPYP
jgi:hypothetical protein